MSSRPDFCAWLCPWLISCRAADAILPSACHTIPPQTDGRTRPPTRPGKLSVFSDVSQRNLGEEGGGGGGGVVPSARPRPTAAVSRLPRRSPPLFLPDPSSSPHLRPPIPPQSGRPSIRPPRLPPLPVHRLVCARQIISLATRAAAATAASLSPSLVKSGRTPQAPFRALSQLSKFNVLCQRAFAIMDL